jgi:hypothetical protein
MGAGYRDVITKESMVAFYKEHSPGTKKGQLPLADRVDVVLRNPLNVTLDGCQRKYGSTPVVTRVAQNTGVLSFLNLSANGLGLGVTDAAALGDAIQHHNWGARVAAAVRYRVLTR